MAPRALGGIRFDVTVGYSGTPAQNAWYPLTCELQNQGAASIEAVIEIDAERNLQTASRRATVELPPNTIKRVTIPMYGSIDGSRSIRLVDQRGKVLAEPSFISAQSKGGRPVLGYLSRSSAGVPSFPEPPNGVNYTARPVVVRVEPELFPDNPLVLDGLACLYISSDRATALTEPQYTALIAWIQNGGHLIVGAEQTGDLTSKEWIRAMIPFEPSGPGVITAKGQLSDWINSYVTSAQMNVGPPSSLTLWRRVHEHSSRADL